ncbi:MAG: hypothetical protein L0Y64_08260, partial [Myxococcaceae bacterium]|nr:hypothetical protein [Myxococcaceae bacterium]
MTAERLDALLEEALRTGIVPDGATGEERAEIERLLSATRPLESVRDVAEREADASLPTARARFQRQLASEAAAVPAPAPRSGVWARLQRRPRALAWAGSLAAVGVALVLAVAVWQAMLGEPTSAYAQVVEPGDYVQVEGVVEATDEVELTLQSALGEVRVSAGGATLVGGDPARGVSGLKAGDRVLVSGIAGEGRSLTARTLALSDVTGDPPRALTFRELLRLRGRLEGVVVTYAVSREGDRGTVVIEAADATRYRVPVDGDSALRLLEAASTALGRRVVAERMANSDTTFTIELSGDPSAGDTPTLVSVRGVITDGRGAPS